MADYAGKDWEDKMMSDTRVRHEKQRYYIDLAEDLGDTIQFDGSKATLYIRGEWKNGKKKEQDDGTVQNN